LSNNQTRSNQEALLARVEQRCIISAIKVSPVIIKSALVFVGVRSYRYAEQQASRAWR